MPTPEAWADSFAQATNKDALIGAHGKHCSCTYMLEMQEQRVIVEMVNLDPRPLDAAAGT